MKTKAEIKEIIANNSVSEAFKILVMSEPKSDGNLSTDDKVFTESREDAEGHEYLVTYPMYEWMQEEYEKILVKGEKKEEFATKEEAWEEAVKFFEVMFFDSIYNFDVDGAKLVLKSYNDLHR